MDRDLNAAINIKAFGRNNSMRKTFQYKAVINKETERNAHEWLYLCRTLYNLALEQRISVYQQRKKGITCFDQGKQLPELKKAFPEFKQVGSQCLQDVLERLDKAYQHFFRRVKTGAEKAGFPRFQGKDFYNSFTLKQSGWKLEGRNLHINNVGRFKLFLSRPVEGDIKTVTVKKQHDKWFVSFSCDNVPEKPLYKTGLQVGIDVGLKSFCVDSDGQAISNPKYFVSTEKELRRKQRSLSRKKRGSSRRGQARIAVSKTCEKISNQRKDFLYKLANEYLKTYDTVYIEDLKVKQLLHNKYLNKHISDSSWSMFFNILEQKALEYGKEIIRVNPRGTTQLCSQCGERVPKTLAVRIHKCPNCGLEMDRDLNAAINIKAFGQNAQASTLEVSGVA